jgi:hypothetical protein
MMFLRLLRKRRKYEIGKANKDERHHEDEEEEEENLRKE